MVLAYKRLEAHSFSWPEIKYGLMSHNHVQFEALFAGLDWRRVRAVEVRLPAGIEQLWHDDSGESLSSVHPNRVP